MLLANYGRSEQAKGLILPHVVGEDEIGSAAAVVDPLVRLEGLADFTYSVGGSSSPDISVASAVGVIEMPDGSFFVSVPEKVDESSRGLLAATHLIHYLCEVPIEQVVNDTARRLRGSDREAYARNITGTMQFASRLLLAVRPDDLVRQSGVSVTSAVNGLRMGSATSFNFLPEVISLDSKLRQGLPIELQRLGVKLSLGEQANIRKEIDGMFIREASLGREPSRRLNKPHVCKGCHIGIPPSHARLTIGTEPDRNGRDHHHFHALCASVSL